MIPAADASWSYLADTVMGGVSEGVAEAEGGAVRLRGTVSTENRGGFIQVRTSVNGLPDDARALVVRVRGNGEPYFIHLRTTRTRLPWQYYQAQFDTSSDWRDVTLPFTEFHPSGGLLPGTLRPGDIRSIGLVAYGRDHVADVSIAAFGWS
ncbi:CIA30 family protein [Roseibacterium sp. SDUM158016]|jgi:hypothetical protein|uniref:CIA30 family protein n=1 Tax=Roseicyclus sediminis TaxID=2980997 RepID=UPI0021CFAFC8|nr:CIA30 family protein [Roseibacterium sp. SDUM158016]MCU4652531.1 CIA30 family protein [Roseibacterium sp. SDUM158016]